MILYTYIIDIIFNKQDVIYLNIIFISSSRAPALYCYLASWLLLPEGHLSPSFPIALHTDYAYSLTENIRPPHSGTPVLAAYLFVFITQVKHYVTKGRARAVRRIHSKVNPICTNVKFTPLDAFSDEYLPVFYKDTSMWVKLR